MVQASINEQSCSHIASNRTHPGLPMKFLPRHWILFVASFSLFVVSIWVLPVINVRGTTRFNFLDKLFDVFGAELNHSKSLWGALAALWNHRSELTNLILLGLLGIPLLLALLKYGCILFILSAGDKSVAALKLFKLLKPQTLISLLEVFICAATVISIFGIDLAILQLSISLGVGVVTYLGAIILCVVLAAQIHHELENRHPHLSVSCKEVITTAIQALQQPMSIAALAATVVVVVVANSGSVWTARPCKHLSATPIAKHSLIDCSNCNSQCVTYIAYSDHPFDGLVVSETLSVNDLKEILDARGAQLTALELSNGGKVDMVREKLHLIASRCQNLSTLRLSDTTTTDTDLVLIRPLTKLKTLYLDGTSISDSGLFHLQRFQALQELDLGTQMFLEKVYSISRPWGSSGPRY